MFLSFNDRNQTSILDGNGKLILDGSFLQTPTEERNMQRQINRLWHQIPKYYRDGMTGIIRFDCIPTFEGGCLDKMVKVGNQQVVDLGRMRIEGVYEVNTHAPECTGSILRHRDNLSRPMYYTRSPYAQLSKLLRTYFKSNEVHILPGRRRGIENVERMCRELRKHGLLVDMIDEGQLLREATPAVWRFGDLKKNPEESEYSQDVWDFLHTEYPHIYMNFMDPQYDLSNKSLFVQDFGDVWRSYVGRNMPFSTMDRNDLLSNRTQWVVKPFSGTRGQSVHIGQDYGAEEWKRVVEEVEKKANDYGVYEAKFLRPFGLFNQTEYVADYNPTYWVDHGRLTFLYTMCRLAPFDIYTKNHLMNVSLGAVLGGMVRNTRYLR